MEGESYKSCLDQDIIKVLTEISFTREKFKQHIAERRRLEKLVSEKEEIIMKMIDAEKINLNHLEENKVLISDQQSTISKLMAVKDEIKKHKEIVSAREQKILAIEQEKYDLLKNIEKKKEEVRNEYKQEIENLQEENKELKNELSIVKSEVVCKSIKSNEDILQAKAEKDEQINKLVLDYEEKLQRAHAQYLRMKDELNNIVEKSNSTINGYQEKIYNLEKKVNQRTNVVKPNMSRNATETPKSTNYRFQYPPASTNQNSIVDNLSSNIDRPLSRASNAYQAIGSASNNRSFQPIAKPKVGNQRSLTPAVDFQKSTYEQHEHVDDKKKTVKRKLFSKFSEEFEEIE